MASSNDEGQAYIYAASIRLKNGKRIYAHQFGLRAFRFKPKKKPPKK